MELRHLRHFIAVAEELHFARAAERLGIEQSPLSQSIRNLEAHLGVRLLQRTTRRTWLTTAGEKFLQDARRIVQDVEALTASTRQRDYNDRQTMRLALGDYLVSLPFTRLLAALEKRLSRDAVELREVPHTEACHLVRDGGSDVAVTFNSRLEPDLAQVCAWSEPLVAIAPLGHDFAARSKVSLTDLKNETLALPSPTGCPGLLAQFNQIFERHSTYPAARREVLHWSTVRSLTATGHTLALCPASLVVSAPDLVVRPLHELDAELTTWILYRQGEPSPVVSLLLGAASDVAAEFLVAAAKNSAA